MQGSSTGGRSGGAMSTERAVSDTAPQPSLDVDLAETPARQPAQLSRERSPPLSRERSPGSSRGGSELAWRGCNSGEDPVGKNGSQRPNFMEFDPSAFRAGDAILGAWRQTEAEFHLRSPMDRVRSRYSTPTPSLPADLDHTETSDVLNADPSSKSCHQWHYKGIRNQYPALHAWLLKRIGTRTSVLLVTSFAVFEAMRFVVAEHAYVRRVNPQSIAVVGNGLSLVFALFLSFLLEGTRAFGKVFSWHPMWRFLGIAVLFASAGALDRLALQSGATSAQVVTVGYIYMPISAILSYFVFRRLYGRLEWLAMGMLTLAILTFVFLREQSKGDTISDIERIRSQYSIPGLLLIICSVVMSVLGSVLAERIFKDRSKGLKWWSARFYVMKVHLDLGQLTVSAFVWAVPFFVDLPSIFGTAGPAPAQPWFGDWRWQQWLMVFVTIGQNWLAGLLVKEFSTVMRALAQSLTLILVMCVEDPILGNRYHFVAREVPTVVLALIVFLSALIFQTGRLNVRDIREAANLGPGSVSAAELPVSEESQDAEAEIEAVSSLDDESVISESTIQTWEGLWPATARDGGAGGAVCCSSAAPEPDGVSGETPSSPLSSTSFKEDAASRSRSRHSLRRTIGVFLTLYALITVYTLSDAARNLLLQRALASTVINSNSMGLMQYVCGVVFASCLTLHTNGKAGIREAMQFRKVLKCMPAGFLFALQATLMNMAYSQGISAALALIVGRVYIPVAALGARCVLGKFYMWLEYLAICILTLATVAFGYLKGFDITTGAPSLTHVSAMLLVMASATTAAFNSLITERLLKGETVPFHMQKIRLDIASTISAVALIPLVGIITVRPQEKPWVERPVSQSCTTAECWDADAGGCSNPACHCECASGVYAGWTSSSLPVIVLALVIGVGYNWLVGKLVQRFSTVHRCIADSFSLILIYFVGDPVLNHTSLNNMCLNLVALIVPLSSALFSVAASEMRWVMDAVALLRGGYDDEENTKASVRNLSFDSDLGGGKTAMESSQGGRRRGASEDDPAAPSSKITRRSASSVSSMGSQVVLQRFSL